MSEVKKRPMAEAGFGVSRRCLRLGVEEMKKSGGRTLEGAAAWPVLSNELRLGVKKF